MVYTIEQIFWCLENGYLNLATGVPDPIDGSDIHQCFNPCHGNIEIPKPIKIDKIEYTSDKREPNESVSHTETIEGGKGIFPNGDGMDYRDPFLEACIFDHKTVTGTWGGGAATYGKITGDFTDDDDRSSIMIQYGKTDKTTPINRCINGGLLVEHILGFKAGGVLKEKVNLETSVVDPNTQAFITDADFDDGQWSLWALKGATQKVYPATVCKVYWDDAHAAEIAGLKIQEAWFSIKVPKTQEKDSSQLYSQHEWNNNHVYEATISGILTGNAELLELEKLFKDKTKKDLRLIWDETANKNKFRQFTDAWCSKMDSYKLTHVAEAEHVSLTFLGLTAIYEGNFEDRPDPTTRIDVSP